ncbi:hypothetical protein BD408DRAFT_446320 [Parasitella parasitica]|nr:hypothetical protein BD408DRAFT_446320 [Parasitella parasitica]
MSQNDPDAVWQLHKTYFPDVDTSKSTIDPIDALMVYSNCIANDSNQIEMVPQDNMIHVGSVNYHPDDNLQRKTCSSVVNEDNVNVGFIQNWSSNEGLQSTNTGSVGRAIVQDNNATVISSKIAETTNLIEINSPANHECEICIMNSRDRGPFDRVSVCGNCQDQWIGFFPRNAFKKTIDDNVSQMLQDQQIRLTRNMAQELVDDYGFGPNIHGYRRHRPVLINFHHQGNSKKDYVGVLHEQKQGKVKVWVPDFHMFEWLPVGSRRLKIMTPHEEKEANQLAGTIDTCVNDEASHLHAETQQTYHEHSKQQTGLDRAPGENKARRKRKRTNRSNVSAQVSNAAAIDENYLTIDTFSTKEAVHPFSDSEGFIPNSHGYTKNQPVQILDVKNGKTKGWCHGTLVKMRLGNVKVRYEKGPDSHEEWLDIGSQRIRLAGDDGSFTSEECLMLVDVDNVSEHEANSLGKLEQKTSDVGSNSRKQNNARPVMSLRIAQLKASGATHFAPNVYGYYYMQHVTVLNNDKKYYEARITSLQKNKVKIHYCGWIDKFDELMPLGSKRIQVLDNDEQIGCLEPNYRERFEGMLHVNNPSCKPDQKKKAIADDSNQCQEAESKDINASNDIAVTQVWCSQCTTEIKQFRYYCSYCEGSSSTAPNNGHNSQSFQLCLTCFDHCFPSWHQHPRSGFATQAVTNNLQQVHDSAILWEQDILQEQDSNADMPLEASKVFTGIDDISTQDRHGYLFLQKWKNRKMCAFCNDDEENSQELGSFVGPFISTIMKLGQEKKRAFWTHHACAQYSPEVVYSAEDGKWYNVTRALIRGRSMRCHFCKEKGATIGCFDSKCSKSFHLPCTKKPVSNFKNGVIFWCSVHEAVHEKKDAYINVFHCDACSKQLSKDESWFTCESCSLVNYFSSFDLCKECYNSHSIHEGHHHDKSDYKETSYKKIEELESIQEQTNKNNPTKKTRLSSRRPRKLPNGPVTTECCYCGTSEAETWRKGYDGGITMCEACFGVVYTKQLAQQDGSFVTDNYAASIEDYSHKPYFTRDTLCFTKPVIGPRLTSYEPLPNQKFSLTFDSTYFDIPGRAPRWATHSGTDYHGTWLPQTVRRALLKYTKKNERVLSNFLGRGTDAIECFLLQRKCCGIDINPAAVALSQRNCCFQVPAGLTFAEYRPIIALADARQLNGSLFSDESYHHILSHPPYKDCVAYSTHLNGDLSRFTQIEDFKQEYTRVIQESYRVLKMSRRVTLGIGDNREHCYYIPVGFHLIRLYIDQGFELEELIVKRQRYCSAFGLGTYLCVQFDFLIFTHEFIATFKKVPHHQIDKMALELDDEPDIANSYNITLYGIPPSAIVRKSRVMGTVWTFKPSTRYSFQLLCVSRMIERFGQDDCNWIHVEFVIDMSRREHDQLEESRSSEKLQMTIKTFTEVETISGYEQARQKKIQENNEILLKLGLVSDLSQESIVNDSIYCDIMLNKKPYIRADLAVMATGHLENLSSKQINFYRKSIIQIAKDAMIQLTVKGLLIIGTKDVRDEKTGKLWPISMLVLEDIERTTNGLKLKELVTTVPEGYSKNRDSTVEQQEQEQVHLPIVHAIYLIFQKQ